jgi:hypothetical protein
MGALGLRIGILPSDDIGPALRAPPPGRAACGHPAFPMGCEHYAAVARAALTVLSTMTGVSNQAIVGAVP